MTAIPKIGFRVGKGSSLGLLAMLITTLLSGPIQGQIDLSDSKKPCNLVNVRASERPDTARVPTNVSVGVRMADLRGIDDIDQTMTVDLLVVQSWTDPRLVPWQGCRVPLESIWSPDLAIVNSGRLFTSLPEVANIGADGRVTTYQRFFGTVANYENLKGFPFDSHVFDIMLLSYQWPADELLLSINSEVTGRRDLLDISDWVVGDVTAIVDKRWAEVFGADYWTYHLLIPVERIWSFYVWKVILPISLIVAMSWCVFWIDPTHFGTQIGLSATSMLTLVAFIFATTNILPKLGYFTTLDRFIVGSTVIVFMALMQSVGTTYLVSKERSRAAGYLDAASRIVFPLAYLAFAYVVLVD
jgi:gamma-aminobutyric acid receptor subunit beta